MPSTDPIDERALIEGLRRGDEASFATLVDAYTPALTRVAMSYVPSRAVAEEVVQEAWVGVLKGLDRFEGRCSLKTWIFKIVTNTAMTRGARERRTVPFSSLGGEENHDEPSVDPDRFLPVEHDRYPEHWAFGPTRWRTPDEGLLSGETRDVILRAIESLPETQRTVITLRDVEGWPAEEVCELLELSEGNQRVLLHRARTKVRAAVEDYFDAVEPTLAPA